MAQALLARNHLSASASCVLARVRKSIMATLYAADKLLLRGAVMRFGRGAAARSGRRDNRRRKSV